MWRFNERKDEGTDSEMTCRPNSIHISKVHGIVRVRLVWHCRRRSRFLVSGPRNAAKSALPRRRSTASRQSYISIPSEEITIIRTHVPLFRFLIFGQAQVPRAPIPHPVLHQNTHGIDDAARRTQTDKPKTDAVPRLEEFRLVLRQEGVCGDDTSDVAETDLPRRTHRAAVMPAEVHGEPADDDGHGRVDAHGDEEESGVFEVVVRVHGDEDAETGDGDEYGEQGEGETMLELVAEEGDHHGEDEGGGPGRDGMELCLDWAVAIAGRGRLTFRVLV